MLEAHEITEYTKVGQVTPNQVLDEKILSSLCSDLEDFLANQIDTTLDYFPALIEQDERWLRYATNPIILDMVSYLIGENIIVWGSALFCKSAVGGKATPWHQDAEYWPIRPLETCTVWIAIDESNQENGCLQIVPGSHLNRKIYEHEYDGDEKIVLSRQISKQNMKKLRPRPVALKPGMLSIHDAFLIHGAEQNNSGKRRAGLTFRYMPSSSFFDRELAKRQSRELDLIDISERQLHLVRGQNLHPGNDIYDPMRN